MKQLIIKLILPLTILSFSGFTKWWYINVSDGPDCIAYGFPLIYSCPGFHTSLSSQYFILEFVIDFLCYFLFCLTITYAIMRVAPFKVKKNISASLWGVSIIIGCFAIFWVSFPDNIFKLKRNYNIEVLEKGYAPGWKNVNQPYKQKYNSNM